MKEFVVAIIVLSVPAWFTHIVVCIKASKWAFLLAGMLFAPLGVVHGWGVWLGVF